MKLGILRISRQLLIDCPIEILEAWRVIGFVPTETQNDFHSDNILYKGISPDFHEVAEGNVVPEYTVIVTGKRIEVQLV